MRKKVGGPNSLIMVFSSLCRLNQYCLVPRIDWSIVLRFGFLVGNATSYPLLNPTQHIFRIIMIDDRCSIYPQKDVVVGSSMCLVFLLSVVVGHISQNSAIQNHFAKESMKLWGKLSTHRDGILRAKLWNAKARRYFVELTEVVGNVSCTRHNWMWERRSVDQTLWSWFSAHSVVWTSTVWFLAQTEALYWGLLRTARRYSLPAVRVNWHSVFPYVWTSRGCTPQLTLHTFCFATGGRRHTEHSFNNGRHCWVAWTWRTHWIRVWTVGDGFGLPKCTGQKETQKAHDIQVLLFVANGVFFDTLSYKLVNVGLDGKLTFQVSNGVRLEGSYVFTCSFLKHLTIGTMNYLDHFFHCIVYRGFVYILVKPVDLSKLTYSCFDIINVDKTTPYYPSFCHWQSRTTLDQVNH